MHRKPNEDWLRSGHEEALEPDMPIVDAHHHLFDRDGWTYLLPEFLKDAQSGHNVVASVHVQTHAFHDAGRPPHLSPVGETEFVNGVAAMCASGAYGPLRACAGIVAFADLRLGPRVEEVLAAHERAAGRRFKGVRQIASWHPEIQATMKAYPAGLLRDGQVQDGVRRLEKFALSFDTFVFHTQLDDVLALAKAAPAAPIVVNHLGGILGVGPYRTERDSVRRRWRDGMRALSALPNVHVKLGGLGMAMTGFGFEDQPAPPGSEALAAAWRPYIETCIELFGADRCMFESNFPVDKATASYAVVWNAFKRIAASCSVEERHALMHGTASRFYRL